MVLVRKFKQKIKDDGRNIKWFYDKFVKDKIDLTYSGFTAQLNGYAPVSEDVEIEISSYLKTLS